ncbi:dihydroorotase, partial [Campylobacter jejuni]|nr:dihydroorotase [Campylobacter jejuni]
DKIVILEKQEWQVAQKYGDVVPFMAGKTLNFKVAN